jgi:hypothetical protein
VLAAWTASPARFRADANAEEDFALGGYRDRLVIELAQNAADAAAHAGQPGRLLLQQYDDRLVVANTGAPLDAPGVESLSTLRASAKRTSETAGRFGVGFAAVLAVTDEPVIASVPGAVGWSRERSAEIVAAVPSLAEELARRGGHVPVLRLPFPVEGPPIPDGYDTAVVVTYRDQAAADLVTRLLDEIDATLLLTLPAVGEVAIEVVGAGKPRRRVLRSRPAPGGVSVEEAGSSTTWRLAASQGRLDPRLLADRPTEERTREDWTLTWAVPVDASGSPAPLPTGVPRVLHAPTPTDEPLDLPAVLIGSFPLDPSRRHVASGPLRDALVAQAAVAYAELLRAVAAETDDPAVLSLLPRPAPAGALDSQLRRAIAGHLPETPFLPAAADRSLRLRPLDAVVLDGATDELVDALAPVLPGLVPTDWSGRRGALDAAGVRRVALADVVDGLGEARWEPAQWRDLYSALAGSDPDALGALPVPLADGRTVRGPRGLLLPGDDVDPDALARLGLRVVHPGAVHPLLERLGARPATAASVLSDPAVRSTVESSWEGDDPGSVAGAVLTLVRSSQVRPGELPWLAELTLHDVDGEPAAAGDLMLPDSPLSSVVAADALGLVGDDLVRRWGADALEAVGVLRRFVVVRDHDVVADPHTVDHDLDDEPRWLTDVLDLLASTDDVPPLLPEITAVRDLELVREGAWPDALRLLSEPDLRQVVVEPVFAVLPGGRRVEVPSYTAWWLRRHVRVGGRRLTELRLPGDWRLQGLYEPTQLAVDHVLLTALGVRSTLEALLAEPEGPQQLVDRLADPELPVRREQLRAVLSALAGVEPQRVAPPTHVRAPSGEATVVVEAQDAVVLDAPDLLPLLGDTPALVVSAPLSAALADVLGIDLASEAVRSAVPTGGVRRPVPEAVRRLLPGVPDTWLEHDDLVVSGTELEWRVVDGSVHAATTAGLARGLAWAAGAWPQRHLLEAVLAEPDRADELVAEAELD